MIFEVTTTTLQRWLVDISERDDFVGLGNAQAALDQKIRAGDVLDAKVPLTMGDEFPWRINAAFIVAYEPYDGPELKPVERAPSAFDSAEEAERHLCHHKDTVEIALPGAQDDRLTHYRCIVCNDTFPLIGDTDQWKPTPVSG